jgi:D-alanine transaminase
MENWVFVNGEFCLAENARVSIFDRGFLFADSIYEVLPVYQGVPLFLSEHLRRLSRSLTAVAIPEPSMQWEELFSNLIEKNGGGNLQIYLQITRGNAGTRNHEFNTSLQPSVIAFTMHNTYPTHAQKKKGLSATLLEDIRWGRCDIKSTALIANILLNNQALTQGSNTAILTKDGNLTEGSASNVFIVDDQGIVKTPPKSHLCLPGITRDITLRLLADCDIPYVETNISNEELLNAKEVWITSTTKEIFPITLINSTTIGDGIGGPLWEKVEPAYKELITALLR